MKFDQDLLRQYRHLLQTTPLQAGYQEFLRLFRYVRIQLAKRLSAYGFSAGIAENAMEYAYFQLSDTALRHQGLKVVIAFDYRTFSFQVWLSGANRNIQKTFFPICQSRALPGLLTADAEHTDYLIRIPLEPELCFGPPERIVETIAGKVEKLTAWVAECAETSHEQEEA